MRKKLESPFQSRFIKRLELEFSGCVVLKNDANYRQGIPDLLMLYKNYWAIFEVKKTKPTKASDFEPNQEWYLDKLDSMSFAVCVYPENEEEVVDALQRQFKTRRTALVSKRKQ